MVERMILNEKMILPVILVISLITGCGVANNNPADNTSIVSRVFEDIPKGEIIFANQFETVSEYPFKNDMMEMLYLNSLTEPDPLAPPGGSSIDDFTGIKDDWPTEYLHPDMPVYTKGRISSWNTWDNYNPYDIFIIIKDTNQEDLDEYILELEARGFYESSGYYSKDLFSVHFEFRSKDKLKINSYKTEPEEWPEEILGFMPPPRKGYLTYVGLEMGESVWGDLRFIEMTEEDIEEYGNDLLAAGFKLDEYGNYIMENVRLNGKTFDEFSGFFERYDTRDWIFYFSFKNY